MHTHTAILPLIWAFALSESSAVGFYLIALWRNDSQQTRDNIYWKQIFNFLSNTCLFNPCGDLLTGQSCITKSVKADQITRKDKEMFIKPSLYCLKIILFYMKG